MATKWDNLYAGDITFRIIKLRKIPEIEKFMKQINFEIMGASEICFLCSIFSSQPKGENLVRAVKCSVGVSVKPSIWCGLEQGTIFLPIATIQFS